jgi:hypothetical protein
MHCALFGEAKRAEGLVDGGGAGAARCGPGKRWWKGARKRGFILGLTYPFAIMGGLRDEGMEEECRLRGAAAGRLDSRWINAARQSGSPQ